MENPAQQVRVGIGVMIVKDGEVLLDSLKTGKNYYDVEEANRLMG